MRLTALALLCLLPTLGCGDDSEKTRVPRSSLAACSFTEACQVAEERCHVSQVCYPPVGTDPSVCEAEQGDRQCHRRCDNNAPCGEGERCQEVRLVRRSDMIESGFICLRD